MIGSIVALATLLLAIGALTGRVRVQGAVALMDHVARAHQLR